jgi:hypothetical protein
MTAPYVPSIAVDDVIDAIAVVILPFVPGGQVVRAQVGMVALPPDPFVLLTELGQYHLDIPYENDDADAQTSTVIGPTRIEVQADFYGANSGDYCEAFRTAFRSMWGCNQFPSNIQPLYTSNAIQNPLITGEQQYETRWTITISLQYTPTVLVPQQSATVITSNELTPVDVFYE